jgi:hypothetical protein
MTAPQPAPDGEAVPDVEAAADEAIEICGGDARAAARHCSRPTAFWSAPCAFR